MHVLMAGLNHKSAPLEIRERLAFGRKQVREAYNALFDHVEEGIILSTCNRTEVYTLTDQGLSERQKLEVFLSEIGNIPSSELAPHLYVSHHEKAIHHLFSVASGLESMILGEFEVLGQVGDALEDAESTGTACLPLLNLFRQAVAVGRRARSETNISRNPVSVSSVAVDLARKVCGDLSGCKILIVSAGEASKLAVKALANHGLSNFIIASRSYEKARALASVYGGRAFPLHDIERPLTESDIVVSCSGAPHFLVKFSLVANAMESRPDRPLVLIDIAVPRDVDPLVKDIGNVYLYNIDDLKSVSLSNQRRRAGEKDKVLAIINDEVASFKAWWQTLETVPTITALVNKAEKIRCAQLDKALKDIQVSDEVRASINAMTQAIIKKILHDPILCLRNDGNGNNHIKAVQELFDLGNAS